MAVKRKKKATKKKVTKKKATKKAATTKKATKKAAPKKAAPAKAKKANKKPEVRDISEIANDTSKPNVVNPYAVEDLRKKGPAAGALSNELPVEGASLETDEEDDQLQFASLDESMDADMEPEDLYEEPSDDPFADLGNNDDFDEEGDDEGYF